MNPEIERRIRAVYAKGYIELVDINQCDFSYVENVESTLMSRLGKVGAGLDCLTVWTQVERVAWGSIGLCAADGTFWNLTQTPEELCNQRLAETKAPGIVCILSISTVFPAWDCHFNLWSPRVNSAPDDPYANHLRCESICESAIPPAWGAIMKEISECCALHGLVRLDKAVIDEDVPFVTESMWLKEYDDLMDDDCNDEYDGFTPSPTQQTCNVAQCLFQHH